MNPILEIDNGAVSIPSNYIQNTSSSITLNAPRGLAESGLQGYYTCRTEGDTFLSPHILHSSKYTGRTEHCTVADPEEGQWGPLTSPFEVDFIRLMYDSPTPLSVLDLASTRLVE